MDLPFLSISINLSPLIPTIIDKFGVYLYHYRLDFLDPNLGLSRSKTDTFGIQKVERLGSKGVKHISSLQFSEFPIVGALSTVDK